MKTFNLYFRKCRTLWRIHAYLRKSPCLYTITLFSVVFFVLYNVRTVIELVVRKEHDVTDYIADLVDVRVQLLDNFRKYEQFRVPMSITLKNTGNRDIYGGSWKIYHNSLHGEVTAELDCGLRLEHVNGQLYTLSPLHENKILIPAYGSIVCNLLSNFPCVSRTDFSPNWYVTSLEPGSRIRIIKSTMGESLTHIGQLDKPNLWKRGPHDNYNPYTPTERFEMNNKFEMKTKSDPFKVIPTPKSAKITTSKFLTIDRSWVIQNSGEFVKEVGYLSDKLKIEVNNHNKNRIRKVIAFIPTSESSYGKEEYELKIDPDTEVINIIAQHPAGAFYGVQTLVSLCGETGRLPAAYIRDKPRFSFRGLMIDVARNFRSKQSIMKVIDMMSTYKMNKLHLHLSDDEGWRLEIPDIPELTQVGSNRCHSNKNNLCLIPSLASGPFVSMPGSGFYTVSDYREILQYAADRHVQVIPEIDMPGHAMAAVFSTNYRETVKAKYSKFTSYRLMDDNASNAISVQNWVGNSINPCLNTSYMFVAKILDTLINLHKGIQDLKVMHIGGDEVSQGVWDNSEACDRLARGAPVSHANLKQLFMYTVADLAAQRGLNIGAWEDGMYEQGSGPYKKADIKPAEVFINPWDNIWENRKGGRAYEFADEGYKVILTLATNLYFDHPYEPDPEERGLYWATRFIDEETVFGFMPDDLFANVARLHNGKVTNKVEFCQNNPCPSTKKPENIVGMQACIWGELIRTESQLYEMLFPRLMAVAERSWHKASWENIQDVTSRDSEKLRDFVSFSNHLGWKELPRLEKAGLTYRMPIPGAVIKDGTLHVNSMYPNHKIVYSENNKAPWFEIEGGKTSLSDSIKSVYVKSVSKISGKSSRAIKVMWY